MGWGSSTRRGGGRKLRAPPRNFVFLGFRRQESGMSREFCRDVPDPWRCSKSLCKKTSCAFFIPYLGRSGEGVMRRNGWPKGLFRESASSLPPQCFQVFGGREGTDYPKAPFWTNVSPHDAFSASLARPQEKRPININVLFGTGSGAVPLQGRPWESSRLFEPQKVTLISRVSLKGPVKQG